MPFIPILEVSTKFQHLLKLLAPSHITPGFFSGVGVSAAIVSFLVGLYYNVILTWCVYYLYKSFRLELPWSVSICDSLRRFKAL